MKKIFRFVVLAVAILSATSLYAQEDPQKQTVIIEPFTTAQGISPSVTDNVRSAVITGLNTVNRVDIIDALADSRLKGLFAEKNYEDVVNEDNWQQESTAAYKALNANFLLKGNVEMYELYKRTDENGNVSFYCMLNFTLQLTDLNDGSIKGSKSYQLNELSVSNVDEAFNNCLKKITGGRNELGINMKPEVLGFCNDYFKVVTYILELGETNKKGVLVDLWISGGEELGDQKGSVFYVYKEKKIGSKVIREKIAEIVAEEVMDGVTRCKVKAKESPIIQQEFNAGTQLEVELDHQSGDVLKDFGKAIFG